MQNQPQSSPQFCSQCGSALPLNAQFCPHCGKPIESSSNSQTAISPTPETQTQKPKSKAMWVVWGVIALLIYGIVAPVMNRAAINSREHERRVAEADNRVEASQEEVRNSIDSMAAIVESAKSTPKLEVQSWKWSKASESYIQIVGEVKNTSTYSLDRVTAIGSFYDEKGDIITATDALIDFQPILPGQTSSFKIIETYNPAMEKVNIAFKEAGGSTIVHTFKEGAE